MNAAAGGSQTTRFERFTFQASSFAGGIDSVEVDGSADAVQVLDITEGKWVLTAMQYIPSGTSGTTRFHMQNTYRNGTIGRSVQWFFSLSDGTIGDDYDTSASAHIIYDEWIELKLVMDLDNDLLEQYYNGELISTRAWVYSGSSQIQSIDLYGNGASSVYYDDIKIQDYLSSLVTAHEPTPEDDATDVLRDAVLAWVAGQSAATHDVYFGTNADDVANADRSNPLDVLAGPDHGAASFDPEGLLDYGQTYSWRVDEVADDGTIYTGDVWTFTTEPFAYPVENIVATSNTTSNAGEGPENTINGSGVDGDGHSTEASDMWLGAAGADPVYIQYEFDRVYKLYEMLVWNYNAEFELVLNFGFKDVTVEYSTDGAEWTVLGDVEFAQAIAQSGYVYNTTVDFGGAAVKYVRLTLNAGYSAIGQYGLSEVRFLYLPVQARKPEPADGATDVAFDTALNWRAGREAVTHEVYLSADAEAVADGTALLGTTSEVSLGAGTLDFATSYYWKVNEVNEAEESAVWEGSVWTFTTQEVATIDGFESYDDDQNRIYDTWTDGWVNGSGAVVGYDTEPFAERNTVNSGRQAMPLEYDNSAAPYYSETSRTWSGGQDWTAGAADTLVLYVHGAADNDAASLYVAVEDTAGNVAVAMHADADVALTEEWVEWRIPLADLAGADLARVETLYVGLGDRDNPAAGGAGIVYIDDIAFGNPAE